MERLADKIKRENFTLQDKGFSTDQEMNNTLRDIFEVEVPKIKESDHLQETDIYTHSTEEPTTKPPEKKEKTPVNIESEKKKKIEKATRKEINEINKRLVEAYFQGVPRLKGFNYSKLPETRTFKVKEIRRIKKEPTTTTEQKPTTWLHKLRSKLFGSRK